MEFLKASALTYKLTALPLTSFVRVESPWHARQSSLLGLGSTFFCPAKTGVESANTRPSTPNCRSPRWLQEFFRRAGMSILLQNPRPTAVLLLGSNGRSGSENSHARE